jgi:hypothetical protein
MADNTTNLQPGLIAITPVRIYREDNQSQLIASFENSGIALGSATNNSGMASVSLQVDTSGNGLILELNSTEGLTFQASDASIKNLVSQDGFILMGQTLGKAGAGNALAQVFCSIYKDEDGNQILTSQQSAIADLAGAATLAQTIAKVNEILAMLRQHGIIAT